MPFLARLIPHTIAPLCMVLAATSFGPSVTSAWGSDNEILSISSMTWRADRNLVRVTGTGSKDGLPFLVKDADSGRVLGNVTRLSDNRWYFGDRNPTSVPCNISVSDTDGRTVTSGYTSDPPETCQALPEAPSEDSPGSTDDPTNPPSETVQGSHAGRFSSFEGTATCLSCHRDEALEMHASVHYQWKGDAYRNHRVETG